MLNRSSILCLLPLLLSFTGGKAQNLDFLYMGATFDRPNSTMMPSMDPMTGFNYRILYHPQRHAQVGIEFSSVFSNYSNRTEWQSFSFNGNAPTELALNYKSGSNRYMLGTRIINIVSPHKIKPFITPQIGLMSMHSRIYIPDPNDEDDCVPLENNLVHRYIGAVAGLETGLELNLMPRSYRGAKNYTGEGVMLVVSCGLIQGLKQFEYINIRHMQDANHQHNASGEKSELTARFIDVTSNTTHDHKIAEVYRSGLQYLNFNVSLTIRSFWEKSKTTW